MGRRRARSYTSMNASRARVRLVRSDFRGPVNIGSEESVSINELVDMIAGIAGKTIGRRHVPGPIGVRGRKSDNRLITSKLGWAPTSRLQGWSRPNLSLDRTTGRARPHGDPCSRRHLIGQVPSWFAIPADGQIVLSSLFAQQPGSMKAESRTLVAARPRRRPGY